jgi:hypothetical protein
MANFSNPTFDTNLSGWIAGSKPNEVSNLVAWYDVSQQNDLGAVYTDGDQVDTFIDATAFNHDLLQTIGTNQPIYKTNILNGYPVLRFNGTTHEMLTDPFTLDSPVTAFSVHIWRSYINSYPSILDGYNTNTLNYVYAGGTMTPYSGGFWAVSHGSTQDVPLFSTLVLNGASSELYADGLSQGTTSVGAMNLGGIRLSHAYGGQWSNADQAEVVFFDANIGATAISQINSYLSLKYAIANMGLGLNVTRDTGTKYAGSASGKLVAVTYDTPFYEIFNSGTGSQTLSCYAYTTGAAVTSADLELYFDGSAQTTTFSSVGGGWYKLEATVTAANTAKKSGVIVKAGKTVYTDSFNLAAGGPPPAIAASRRIIVL